VKAVADVIGVARSHLVERMKSRPRQRLGRPPAPADALVAEIKAVIADLPTYGYRRVHASAAKPWLRAASPRTTSGSIG
jgi:putative transposase